METAPRSTTQGGGLLIFARARRPRNYLAEFIPHRIYSGAGLEVRGKNSSRHNPWSLPRIIPKGFMWGRALAWTGEFLAATF